MNGCGKIKYESQGKRKMLDLNQKILAANMVGKYWEEVQKKEVMICLLFTETWCGITTNGDEDGLI